MKEFLKNRQHIIAANIKQTRAEKNLTAGFVASAMKMSPDGYHQLELGQIEFTLNCLFKLAAILDVNILELIENDPQLIQLSGDDRVSASPSD